MLKGKVIEPRVEAQAYCPKCEVFCWWPVGTEHYKFCDGILIPKEQAPSKENRHL